MIGVSNILAPIVVNHLMVTIVRIVVILKCFINPFNIILMSKETKDSMAVRQYMEAASDAAQAYFKEDEENRAVFQILVERENEKNPGSTGCICAGYGNLLTMGVDNAIDNCEGFRNSLILALGRRNPLLGMLLATMLNPNEEGEEE